MQNGHTLFSQSYATYLGIKLDELNRLYPEKGSLAVSGICSMRYNKFSPLYAPMKDFSNEL